MARQDLLDKGRAGTGHAHDKDGQWRGVACKRSIGKKILVEGVANRVEEAECLCLIVFQLGPLEACPRLKVLEGLM
jgi:hypothetical protein